MGKESLDTKVADIKIFVFDWIPNWHAEELILGGLKPENILACSVNHEKAIEAIRNYDGKIPVAILETNLPRWGAENKAIQYDKNQPNTEAYEEDYYRYKREVEEKGRDEWIEFAWQHEENLQKAQEGAYDAEERLENAKRFETSVKEIRESLKALEKALIEHNPEIKIYHVLCPPENKDKLDKMEKLGIIKSDVENIIWATHRGSNTLNPLYKFGKELSNKLGEYY